MEAHHLMKLPEDATFPSRLRELAGEKPDKPAFVFVDVKLGRTVLTRRDVWDMSRKFAALLKREGVQKGDVVCNCLANSPQRLISTYGTLLAGSFPLHGQILLADGEDFFNNLNTAKCRVVLLDPGENKGADHLLTQIRYTDDETGQIRYKGVPYLEKTIFVNVYEKDDDGDRCANKTGEYYQAFEDMLSHESVYEDTSIKSTDLAFLFVTSGTTGYSKVMQHSHKSCLAFGNRFSWCTGAFDEDAILFNDRSFGWSAGQPSSYPTRGCTRVLTDMRYGPPDDFKTHICQVLARENCDCAFFVPMHVLELSQTIAKYEDQSHFPFKLRVFGTAGGPLSSQCMTSIGIFTDEVMAIYGSSECGIIACLPVKDKHSYEDADVGHPCYGVQIRVVDDNCQDVPEGEIGETAIRSCMVTDSYLNNSEKNKESFFQDGWFRLGDMAHFNNKGHLFVFCRKANAIMRGSFVQYPGWMEARLNKCPSVQSAVLVGVPDEEMHEEVCACIVPMPSSDLQEADMRQFCQDMFLSVTNKDMTPVPKYFLFFDKLPTNQNGKLARRVLKKDVVKLLNLH